MTRRLPPLNHLRAFEAAARRSSFAHAAAELGVTPAAVSHQVKALEARLSVALFHRRPNGLVLTAAGRDLLPGISDGFDRLAQAAARLTDADLTGAVVLSALPGFAAGWLAPRLARLGRRFPGLSLTVRSEVQRVDFRRDAVDLAIRYGTGGFPGLAARDLRGEDVFPVCSPRLWPAGRAATLNDLRRLPLLHDIDGGPAQPWIDWSAWLGGGPLPGPRFSDAATATAAAVAGQGVLLGRDAMLGDHLAAGRLVAPVAERRRSGWRYFVVAPASHFARPLLAALADWLIAEARGEFAPKSDHEDSNP